MRREGSGRQGHRLIQTLGGGFGSPLYPTHPMNTATLYGFTFDVDSDVLTNAWGDYYEDSLGALYSFNPDDCPADIVLERYCVTARHILTRSLAEAGQLPPVVFDEILERVRTTIESDLDRYID